MSAASDPTLTTDPIARPWLPLPIRQSAFDAKASSDCLDQIQTWLDLRAEGKGESKPGWRLTRSESNRTATLAEWSRTIAGQKRSRMLVVVPGWKIALLAEQVEGTTSAGPAWASWPLASGVAAGPTGEARSLWLRQGKKQALALPIAIPARPLSSQRGSLEAESGELRLSVDSMGKRTWCPLLLSWDPVHNRKPATWRVLTVAEKSRPTPHDVAFATRVEWGRGDSLIVYRSLGRVGSRSFLGHHVRNRFLFGRFDRLEGTVAPWITVD